MWALSQPRPQPQPSRTIWGRESCLPALCRGAGARLSSSAGCRQHRGAAPASSAPGRTRASKEGCDVAEGAKGRGREVDRQTDAHLTANSLRLGVYRRGVSLGCMASSTVHPLGCSPAVQEDAGVGGEVGHLEHPLSLERLWGSSDSPGTPIPAGDHRLNAAPQELAPVTAPQPWVWTEIPVLLPVRTSLCWAPSALSCPGLGERSHEGYCSVSHLQGSAQGAGRAPRSLFLSFPSVQKIASV